MVFNVCTFLHQFVSGYWLLRLCYFVLSPRIIRKIRDLFSVRIREKIFTRDFVTAGMCEFSYMT